MRTLIGHEAIDVAEQHDIPLFDRYQNNEITAEQAKSLIQRRRDPASFVLEDWPESDKEAEQVVLRRFHIATSAHNMHEASISDICNLDMVGRSIHPYAAEVAAERLVDQKALETVQSHPDEQLYRMARNTYFKESFLEGLRSQVCDECAHLNLEKPFHKTCLMALIDYLINGEFTFNDVTDIADSSGPSGMKLQNLLHGASAKLSQTVTATKGRLRSVVKPILNQSRTDVGAGPLTYAGSHDVASMDGDTDPGVDATEFRNRAKISKTELVSFLRSVEIVDEDGELTELRSEHAQALRHLEAKEREIQQLERQRLLLQGQCEDMQRDMDTLLQAMQIAKRRSYNPSQVIDAEVERG